MPIKQNSRFAFAGLLLFALAGTSQVNQTSGTAQEKQKEIKQVPIAYTEPTSGAEMYKNYCAACHGVKRKG